MTTATQDAAPPAGDIRSLGSLAAAGWLAWFSVREMARRRRLIALGLINLLPVLVVLAARLWWHEPGGTAQVLLAALSHDVFMPFLIPIVAMAVGV